MKKISIYTDGACSGNPGVGGWAAILIYNDNKKQLCGYDKFTTNNRMELFAVIQGLRALKEPCDIDIYSDSAYVCDAFNKNWIKAWVDSNWKTSNNQSVKNQDLWNALLFETRKHKFTMIKVKGHSDNEYNNLCDELAVAEINKCKQLSIKEPTV